MTPRLHCRRGDRQFRGYKICSPAERGGVLRGLNHRHLSPVGVSCYRPDDSKISSEAVLVWYAQLDVS